MKERVLGEHAVCGGQVVYISGITFGYRRCLKCGHDGRYGTPSPVLRKEIDDKEKS